MKKYKTKYGYFADDGSCYIITRPDTPSPWVNVICPDEYGVIVSQTGGGYSWLTHSKLNRITRWQQDLLRDANGKYLFIQDTDTNKIWSPTWQPVKREYEFFNCIHGIGWTKFINKTEGIKTSLKIFVPPKAQLEIWKVKVANESKKTRKIKLFTYLEWCLGDSLSVEYRELHNLFIETTATSEKEIMATKRVWTVPNEKGQFFNRSWEWTAYHFGNPAPKKYSSNRENFIGRYGDLSHPALKGFKKFPNRDKIDKWDESIASLMWEMELAPGEEKEYEIFIGVEKEKKNIKKIRKKYFNQTENFYKKTLQHWEGLLNKTYIKTPDAGFNFMMNYWLKYQALSARLLGRTGYYQPGGAFGFRDQLQDSQIYFKLNPEKAREKILLHASRQYKDGAVQHWWHPISDEGLRNKISDNLLWLPYITKRYIMETGDYEILHKEVSYLDGKKESLLKHCENAIERVWNKRSPRGIPLIGEGDWNDGLSAVGWEGKGESIWLGHFLVGILKDWAEIEKTLGSKYRFDSYLKNALKLSKVLNKYCWDGNWYIRAVNDKGEVLGSKSSKYGKIFLNAQTWAILNNVADKKRLPLIQKSLEKNLYKKYGPILFEPAYKKSNADIGYLTRYAPGVRENGGLYFHATCWAVAAECEMKRPDKVQYLLNSFLPPYRGLKPDLYCAEPYVLPGNVDGPDSPYFGRGGWTWYTGSAAWLFMVCWDWVLGFMPVEGGLRITPCIPDTWDNVSGYRYFRGKKLEFTIHNSGKKKNEIIANGKKLKGNLLNIEDFKDTKKIKLTIIGKGS